MGIRSELGRNLGKFRQRLYRSDHGKLLGVFSGMAESLGFCITWTRMVGVCVLLGIAGSAGAEGFKTHILVAGFFYLLLAMVMQPPRKAGSLQPPRDDDDDSLFSPPSMPSMPFWRRDRAATAPNYQAPRPTAGRVDLLQLDRQLDGLDRRIQRMETIVTDRQYDWDRRMES